MSAIEDVCRELERLVTIHGEPQNAVETGYNLKAIKDLFSLEQSKGEILKYPTFAGDAGQDFMKFKEKRSTGSRGTRWPSRILWRSYERI